MKVYVVVMLLILVLGSLLIMLQIDDDLEETTNKQITRLENFAHPYTETYTDIPAVVIGGG